MLPEDDPLKALGHGAAGAEWLRQRGYAELARPWRVHPVMELGCSRRRMRHGRTSAGLIGRVVTYADKRARQDVLSLTDRFARWHENYPDSPRLDEAERRAQRWNAKSASSQVFRPSEVTRLAWVKGALRAAA